MKRKQFISIYSSTSHSTLLREVRATGQELEAGAGAEAEATRSEWYLLICSACVLIALRATSPVVALPRELNCPSNTYQESAPQADPLTNQEGHFLNWGSFY